MTCNNIHPDWCDLDSCEEGDFLLVEDGFTCMKPNDIKEIYSDKNFELFVECSEGIHYLSSQTDECNCLIGLNIYRYKNQYKVDEMTAILTIEDWKESCEFGAFIDYDGYGTLLMKIDENFYVVRDNFHPSDYMENFREIPKHVTHISWYNR